MGLKFGDHEFEPFNRGGLLMGTWFFAISWAMIGKQVYTYFQCFPEDPILLRALVLFLFCNETASFALACQATYHHIINLFNKPFEAMIPSLSISVLPVMSSVTILGVNIFLIWRYHRLTKRLYLSIALLLLALSAQACISWAEYINIKFFSADLMDLPALMLLMDKGAASAKAGLAMEVAMISSITLLLLVHLLTFLKNDVQDTRRMLLRLIVVTMESGVAATILAIVNLVYLLLHPTSTNLIILALCTSRVYFMGVLFNLNTRGDGGFVMRESSGLSRSGSVQRGAFSQPKTYLSRSAQQSHVGTVVVETSPIDTFQPELKFGNASRSSSDFERGQEDSSRKAGVSFA